MMLYSLTNEYNWEYNAHPAMVLPNAVLRLINIAILCLLAPRAGGFVGLAPGPWQRFVALVDFKIVNLSQLVNNFFQNIFSLLLQRFTGRKIF